MSETFFERPILNSPYDKPGKHWELDDTGQPTQHVIPQRRSAKYVTPIPKAKKQKKGQASLLLHNDGISTEDQQYDPTPIINEIRAHVDRWRLLAPSQWVYQTERHLLYVACTRARDQLLVTGVGEGSEFLEDLRISV